MKLKISSLLLMVAVLFGAFACGGGGGSNNSQEKTIKGVALKADGTPFNASAKIIAVDESGNTAEGTVDASGNYSVKLVASASSGKKSKDLSGNTFLRATDGVDSIDLVIADDQTNINFNAITSAASGLALGNSGVNLNDIFDEADAANGKKGKGEVSNAAVLAALAKVQVITQALFKNNANTIAGALFGFDSTGKPVIDADKLITGGAKEKEITLIKAAASLDSDLIGKAIAAANNPANTSFLFNDDAFFAALGDELASNEGNGNNAFSDFLNSVLKSDELKTALKELGTALNQYVTDVKANSGTPVEFTVEIPVLVEGGKNVVVTATLASQVITYSIADGLNGDSVIASLSVFSGTTLNAVVTAKLKANSDGTSVAISDINVVVGTASVSFTNDETNAIVSGNTIDLSKALESATTALDRSGITATVPSSISGLTLFVNSTTIIRSGKVVPTFIKVGSTTANSVTGVFLQ